MPRGPQMNHRALVVASNLVEQGLHLRASSEHTSLHDWIDEVARESALFTAACARFDDLTATNPPANTAGHAMTFEYGRAAYELGVQVGLRIRDVDGHA